MFSRKTLGIAGAAILGTLVGTNAAHAVIVVDADGDATNQVKYAKETLTTNATVSSGGKTYYTVTGPSNQLDVTVPLGFATGGAESIIVLYTLGGMVFSEEVTAAHLDMTNAAGASKSFSDVRLNGGAKGDSTVEFSITASAAVAPTDLLTLNIGSLAVDAAAVGSITTLASYDVSATRSISETVTVSDAVTVMNALKETVTAASSTPVALVEEGFMQFGDPESASTSSDGLRATIGSITIGFEDGTLAASDSAAITAANMAAELLGASQSDGSDGATLNFTGDLGFVSDVFLGTADDCPTAGNVTLYEEDDAKVKSWKGDAADFADVDGTGAHLCILVDGMTVIPATSYAVTIDYAALANAAFPPADSTKTVGSIKRDGTTVHIPYLSVDERHNQRLIIMNNGPATTYALTFKARAGVMATAGDDASGPLPSGVTVLSLRADDVVTLDSGKSTAATLDVVAPKSMIEVSTTLLNREDGSTDTVVYEAEGAHH